LKPLDSSDAWAIQKKLKAEVDSSARRHILVKFWHKGILLVQFGIRRGSGELGHGFIPREMKISQKQCREFRQCTLSVEAYLEILKSKGLVS
jgi:hypothetical protein